MGDITFVLYYHHERAGSMDDNDDLYDPLKIEEGKPNRTCVRAVVMIVKAKKAVASREI